LRILRSLMSFPELSGQISDWGTDLAGSDVHGLASGHGPGQARLGQSHGLTMALARPEILESRSCWLRLRLCYDSFGQNADDILYDRKHFLNNFSEL
jgi:hypothetical protein